MRVVYYGHELYHAATGAQRDNHQYIARVQVGDKFRYFYDQAQLAAYNAGKNIQGAAKAAGDAVTKAGKNIQNTASKLKSDFEKARIRDANAAEVKKYKDPHKFSESTRKIINSKNFNEEYKGDYRNNFLSNEAQRINSKTEKDMRAFAKTKGTKYDPRTEGRAKDQNSQSKKYSGNWAVNKARYDKEIQDSMQKLYGKGKYMDPHEYKEPGQIRNDSFIVAMNQAESRETGKPVYMEATSKPKNNQGIVGKTYAEGRNRPKNNQGIISSTKGKNNAPKNNQGVNIGSPYVSDEYKEELEYNSRKNNYNPAIVPRTKETKKKEPDIYKHKPEGWSDEYWKEYVYNSKKNRF